MVKSLAFANKVLLTDKGQMVFVSRVVLPEYAGKLKLKNEEKQEDSDMRISIHRFKTDPNGDSVTLIAFVCEQEQYFDLKEKKVKKSLVFKSLQYRLVGPYLCYRQYTDDKIRIRKVIGVDDDSAEPVERFISLKPILIDPVDKKHVTFARIPTSSFQTMKGEDA